MGGQTFSPETHVGGVENKKGVTQKKRNILDETAEFIALQIDGARVCCPFIENGILNAWRVIGLDLAPPLRIC